MFIQMLTKNDETRSYAVLVIIGEERLNDDQCPRVVVLHRQTLHN